MPSFSRLFQPRLCGPALTVWNAGHLPRWCDDDVGARNEFNSTALRNWLRSHSSGKFLIVCPAPSREFARSPPPRGPVTALLRRADHQYLCPGHSRGISSVPGSFSDPCPAGPLMVMVITGPNCEQWNYEISKLAACGTVLSPLCSFCGGSLHRSSCLDREETLHFITIGIFGAFIRPRLAYCSRITYKFLKKKRERETY